MKLIIGLGNPGKKYDKTRHNIGWWLIDYLRKELRLPEFKTEKKFLSIVTKGYLLGQKIILAKPLTFMNDSGKAVALLKNYYKINPEDILVIRDDIDLPFGKYREKQNSRSGGHQGVNSIISHLKTKNFIQVKIGIKNNERLKKEAADFVLQKFNQQEKEQLKKLLPQYVEKIKKFF